MSDSEQFMGSNYEINPLFFVHHFGLDKGVRTVILSPERSEGTEGSLLFDGKRFFASFRRCTEFVEVMTKTKFIVIQELTCFRGM
jgi:hypothetical protein